MASDIQLVSTGADLLSDSDAERHAAWSLAVLQEPGRIQPLTQSVPWTYRYVVEMLRSLWPRLGPRVTDATRSFLTEMPYRANQLIAEEFARLVRTIGSRGWTEHQISGIRGRIAAIEGMDETGSDSPDGQSESTAGHDQQSLADAWRWLLSEAGDEARKQQPLREAADGSPEALLAIGNVKGFRLMWQPTSSDT